MALGSLGRYSLPCANQQHVLVTILPSDQAEAIGRDVQQEVTDLMIAFIQEHKAIQY